MLVSAALVLMMTGPGLALFYCGLVRKKNVLGTMMQSFAMMAVVTLIWAVCGYSLVFGAGQRRSSATCATCSCAAWDEPNPIYAPTIPQQTFMIYQLMFAIITPALITGAFAERVHFRAMVLFSTLWAFFVYFPVAHMVWGTGGFLNAFLGGKYPVFDFAGGTVVHITSGFSALVTALYIGKRRRLSAREDVPHNLVLSFIGACLLWVGWFGFNAGSALGGVSAGHQRIRGYALCRRGRRLAWMAAERVRNGKASALGAISGAVAGLATVTQGAGFVQPIQRRAHRPDRRARLLLHGRRVKDRFGYDDSLDAFGVHGVGGTMGALLTGVFASSAINPHLRQGRAGPRQGPRDGVDGNPAQVAAQVRPPPALHGGIAIVGTLAILFVVDVLVGVRVSRRRRRTGSRSISARRTGLRLGVHTS